MLVFYNGDILNDDSINKLNDSIDNVIEDKEAVNLDYDLLTFALKNMLINRKPIKSRPKAVETYLSKEEAIKTMLNFFKSIDEEYYNKAIQTVLQQSNKIKMNIYNRKKIKNYDLQDENGIKEYDIGGSVSSRKGFSIVHIPVNDDKHLTIDELYTLVHEIVHLFDRPDTYTAPTKNDLIEKGNFEEDKIDAVDLLSESITILFEGMLTDYLLKNTTYSRSAIKEHICYRTKNLYIHTEQVYAMLLLAKQKEKEDIISREWIKNTILNNYFNPEYIKAILDNIINNNGEGMQIEKRYAIAGLIYPTIIKQYLNDKENGVKKIKQYIELVKNNDFYGALSVFDIQLNKEGINKLAQISGEQEHFWNQIIESEEHSL